MFVEDFSTDDKHNNTAKQSRVSGYAQAKPAATETAKASSASATEIATLLN